jgi:DNA-binding MarR family transcriptional regulator
MSSRSLSFGELRALADFRFEIRRYLAFAEGEASRAGIEPKQYQLMLALAAMPEEEPVTIGALAERLLTRHHSAVGLVDRLEAKRLVRRTRSDIDGRFVTVSLTAAGREVLEKLSLLHQDELVRIAPLVVTTLQTILKSAKQVKR